MQARRYAAHVPQTLVVKFADGTAETLPWPEDERWHRWVLERPVPAESAQIDPQRAWFLDVNKLDDGRSREAHPLAARRWTLEAVAWLQTLLAFVEAL